MNERIRNALGYAGLLPFISLAVLFVSADAQKADRELVFIFGAYSCVIISFMAGTLWGQVLQHSAAQPLSFVTSNIITLVSWLALLLAYHHVVYYALTLLTLCYICLFAFERLYLWNKLAKIDTAYSKLRMRLTGIVILCHLVVIVVLILDQ